MARGGGGETELSEVVAIAKKIRVVVAEAPDIPGKCSGTETVSESLVERDRTLRGLYCSRRQIIESEHTCRGNEQSAVSTGI